MLYENHGKGVCKCKDCYWVKYGDISWGGTISKYFSWDPDAYHPTDRAVVAFYNKKMVGILKYRLWEYPTEEKHKTLVSCGTFVKPSLRRCGVAAHLWQAAIKLDKPKGIKVMAASDRGFTLIQHLRERYPKLEWEISQCGDRELRVLRKS